MLPAMKLRLARPAVLVDIGRLAELSYVRDGGEHVAIGALTRHHDVHGIPSCKSTVRSSRSQQGRSGIHRSAIRGTIGGALAHGHPVRHVRGCSRSTRSWRSRAGRRTDGSGRGLLHRLLRPRSDPTRCSSRCVSGSVLGGWSYVKMRRRAQDWATVAVAAIVERTNGSVGKASIGLTNMGATPLGLGERRTHSRGRYADREAAALISEGPIRSPIRRRARSSAVIWRRSSGGERSRRRWRGEGFAR